MITGEAPMLDDPSTPSGDLTRLLASVAAGDQSAAARIFPLVYGELRRIAARYMRHERPGQTIDPTELVHEAYLRLIGQDRIGYKGRVEFFALAATSMRHILVDRARRKMALRHGGFQRKVSLGDAIVFSSGKPWELLELDEALNKLADLAPRQSRVVEMRFFAGLTVEEIAEVEGLTVRSIKRDWSAARAWLHREIARGGGKL